MNPTSERATRHNRSPVFSAIVATLLIYGATLAQYRVNNQIYGNPGPSVRYANAYSQPGQTSQMMPSEYRNATFRSGALPSDIRMNYASVGPLAPQGPAAYIPPSGPRYTVASPGSSLNYVNTQVSSPGAAAMSAPRYTSTPAMSGSVRYSSPTPSSFNVNSAAMFPSPSASSLNSFNPGAVPLNSAVGSVRYAP